MYLGNLGPKTQVIFQAKTQAKIFSIELGPCRACLCDARRDRLDPQLHVRRLPAGRQQFRVQEEGVERVRRDGRSADQRGERFNTLEKIIAKVQFEKEPL